MQKSYLTILRRLSLIIYLRKSNISSFYKKKKKGRLGELEEQELEEQGIAATSNAELPMLVIKKQRL